MIKDPLSDAVKNLFGLSYLFPYQRLVITNILEAASASGIQINWYTAKKNTTDRKFETTTEILPSDEA